MINTFSPLCLNMFLIIFLIQKYFFILKMFLFERFFYLKENEKFFLRKLKRTLIVISKCNLKRLHWGLFWQLSKSSLAKVWSIFNSLEVDLCLIRLKVVLCNNFIPSCFIIKFHYEKTCWNGTENICWQDCFHFVLRLGVPNGHHFGLDFDIVGNYSIRIEKRYNM